MVMTEANVCFLKGKDKQSGEYVQFKMLKKVGYDRTAEVRQNINTVEKGGSVVGSVGLSVCQQDYSKSRVMDLDPLFV